ncbi:MAG: hypothetical protein CMB80_08160 [Flammeovirgaceae bacterium]|nr:hypothetical protein [Flammeovirgaceae bacterium]|tara:strand:+ start:884 stop:1144 length:261 start_codon:yes stop_codon:yes gene_type:complete
MGFDDFEGLPDEPTNGDWARYSFYVLNKLKTIDDRLITIESAIVDLGQEHAVFKDRWKYVNIAWGFAVTAIATVASIVTSIVLKMS